MNAESSPLQPANRDGGIDQDWASDDQDWWDWYVTRAENDDAPIALVAGPGLPDVDPADYEQLRVENADAKLGAYGPRLGYPHISAARGAGVCGNCGLGPGAAPGGRCTGSSGRYWW